MADQPKKKNTTAVTRNPNRRNGKAAKSDPGNVYYKSDRNEYRGSHVRGVRLSELEKALLGGGAMRRITRRLPGVSVDR